MDEYGAPAGVITIAPAALATVVRMTTLAHPDVLRIATRVTTNIPQRRGKPVLGEGLRVEMLGDDAVSVDVHVIAVPNASLSELGKDLQTGIARALADIAGMDARSVNVFIDQLDFQAAGKDVP